VQVLDSSASFSASLDTRNLSVVGSYLRSSDPFSLGNLGSGVQSNGTSVALGGSDFGANITISGGTRPPLSVDNMFNSTNGTLTFHNNTTVGTSGGPNVSFDLSEYVGRWFGGIVAHACSRIGVCKWWLPYRLVMLKNTHVQRAVAAGLESLTAMWQLQNSCPPRCRLLLLA
jgi:hypothetical protein